MRDKIFINEILIKSLIEEAQLRLKIPRVTLLNLRRDYKENGAWVMVKLTIFNSIKRLLLLSIAHTHEAFGRSFSRTYVAHTLRIKVVKGLDRIEA